MEKFEVLNQLTDLLRDILDQDDLEVGRDTTANEVDGWDSLTHVRIVVAAEQKFGIRFTTAEITDLPNVGALVDAIASKLS